MDWVSVIAGGGPTLVTLGAAYWAKKWINGVDKKLDKLDERVEKLVISEAVTEQQKSELRGSIGELRESIKETDGNIKALSNSVKKAWDVLEANRDKLKVPIRLSGSEGN